MWAMLFMLAHLMVVAVAPAGAQQLMLGDFILDNQAGNIMVRFSLHVEEVDELALILDEGAKLALESHAYLKQEKFLYNATVSEREYNSILSMDALTREYVLDRPDMEQPLRGKELADVLEQGWGRITMDMGPFDTLDRGNDYTLELEVSLKYHDVPSWLKTSLFFWSWNAAPSASYSMDLEY